MQELNFGFRLSTDSTELPPSDSLVITLLKKNSRADRFLGIFKGKTPVAWVLYSKFFRTATIGVWGNFRKNQLDSVNEFKERFGVFPSRYLIEELIRKNIRKFVTWHREPDGIKMTDFFEKKKLLARRRTFRKSNIKYEVTPKWIEIAKARTRQLH